MALHTTAKRNCQVDTEISIRRVEGSTSYAQQILCAAAISPSRLTAGSFPRVAAGRLTIEPLWKIEHAMWLMRRRCLPHLKLTSKGLSKQGIEVQVTAVRATSLPAADSGTHFSSIDPYTELNGVHQAFKTTWKTRTLDPEWNECFKFFFKSQAELASSGSVEAVIKDYNLLGADDELCHTIVALHTLEARALPAARVNGAGACSVSLCGGGSRGFVGGVASLRQGPCLSPKVGAL